MKTRAHWRWSAGLVLAVLSVAGVNLHEVNSQLTNAPPEVRPGEGSNSVAQATADQTTPAAGENEETDLSDAAFQPISTNQPAPPNLKPTGPVGEVIRLAQAGVEEGVMLAFVTNSAGVFGLGAEEIIYLNDIGVPSAVVTAMIERDQALKELSAAGGATVATTPPPPVSTDQYAPVPEAPAPEETPPAPGPGPTEMASETVPPPEYAPADYAVAPPEGDAYSTYYDSLAPYGSWVDVAGYGPCWQPTVVVVNSTWQPYCNGGRWVYTDCGWYWLSDYSWGWAPFHYGRWFRHQRLGWCWAPDRVWGPSWVCWRYTSAYCAWAPLPPGALYRPGVGLMYRGRQVGSTFGFGLGASSFAVVGFNHFWERQLPRHTLPQQEATRVLSQTVPTASIVGSDRRVINNGLPPSYVVAATHTGIHRVPVHHSDHAAAPGVRTERLEGNGSGITVSRPHWPHQTGNQPSASDRVRTGGNRSGGGLPGVRTTPIPAPKQSPERRSEPMGPRPRIAERPSPRADNLSSEATTTAKTTARSSAGSAAGLIYAPSAKPGPGYNHTSRNPVERARTEPSSTQRFATWQNRGLVQGSTPANTTTTGSARSAPEMKGTFAPKPAAPLILHGSDRTSQTAAGRRETAGKESAPRGSLIVSGNRERTPGSTFSYSQAPYAQTRPSQAITPSSSSSPKAQMSQRRQAPASVAPEVQRPSYSARSIPAPAPAERHYSAPSYRAPEVSRPAPAPTPSPQRTYSAPAPSYTPPARAAVSRPSYSAPASSAGRSSSSSSWRGR